MPALNLLYTLRCRFPLSREGMWWLILTAAMLLTGLIKSINLITLLACILLAIGSFNLYLAWRQTRWLIVHRELPDFMVAGQPGVWRIRIGATNRRRLEGLEVIDAPWGESLAWIVDIEAAKNRTVETMVVPPRRGVFPLDPVVASSGYPLGLASVKRPLSMADSVHVAPRLGTINRARLRRWLSRTTPSLGRVRAWPMRHASSQAEFHGLRPFRTGDSPRHIHWRTSARRGQLMVREFDEFPNDDLVLLLDPTLHHPLHVEAFERMLSVAATVCWEWCRQKGDRLTLLILGPSPQRFQGVTGQILLTQTLQALASLTPQVPMRFDATVAAAEGAPLPPTAHLLLSVGPSQAPRAIFERLQQPIATADIAATEESAFFELP